jgi:integrase
VAKRAGLDGVRLHDLRHTYASFGAGGGLGLPIIGKLLGHRSDMHISMPILCVVHRRRLAAGSPPRSTGGAPRPWCR